VRIGVHYGGYARTTTQLSNLGQVELDEHRAAVTTEQPSLPHEAGKGIRRVERLYLLAITVSVTVPAGRSRSA